MRWRMRIGPYKPEAVITLLDGHIDPPTGATEEFRERYAYPGMTDEDLFCLVFFDFAHSIKVALLDEGPLTPQEVHARSAAVYERAREERTRESRARGERRRAMNDYLAFCDQLYKLWSKDEIASEGWSDADLRKVLGKKVSFDHAPEPYLTFDGADIKDIDAPPLVFLTTNPGGPQDFQDREHTGRWPSYDDLQTRLVCDHYENGIAHSAQLRIKRMRKIADLLRPLTGSIGFVQCEAVPFHSSSLPGKRRLAKYLREEGLKSALAIYQEHLKVFLADKHVISLDASNSPASHNWEHWLRRKAYLIGFDEEVKPKQKCLGSSPSGQASTCVDSQSKNGDIRACYLTRGGNVFRNDAQELCDFLVAEARI